MSGRSELPAPSRRTVLGVAGVACGAVLTGCSQGEPGGGGEVPAAIKGKVIAQKGDIPVGGGKVITKYKVVITQPTQGVFKAFSARCPHKGCNVGRVTDGVIICPCHGSEFAVDSGAAKKGPAEGPLREYKVELQGDGIAVV
ncbi:Rieske (2Fe-2S) protein [Bailinhaonella thermotolerans]|uniref:Rieske (2Fe-2S) protein n=1 Tax=Bailinhaonella thermotolerans TaxID=1070861 RepID=A0A3A4B0F5_9ACTN|nr:Rieske (2Fe-2S) protein [Bailinhaonella thermotolerans]RJL36147.1 Rieske (2Fe-2S) protein [Bailinhaonella thermotolerans]